MANPKYELWLTEKEDTKSRSRIGVAFESDYATLTIKLGPGVLIDARVRDTCYITLKPWKGKPGADSVADKRLDVDDDVIR